MQDPDSSIDPALPAPARRPRRVMVVGSGTRFLSGISVYSVHLANALADAGEQVSLMTMRRLLPAFLYPGRERVGRALTDIRLRGSVPLFDGVDWYWLPSMLRATWFMARRRPRTIVLQWWSGTVLHSYLALSILARLLGARVIVEFHEVLDTAEARIPPARLYARLVGGAVVRLASGFAVHSAFDEALLRRHWCLGARPTTVLPHGPYDHTRPADDRGSAVILRDAPEGATNLLFFGVIRPYKGLEDLVDAFDALSDDEVGGYWLTVVGETWEGWTLPAERIAASRHHGRITFVNRYVHDAELDGFLRGADAVVLPYRRSSLSGPLHVAMAYGLPIVLSDAGGNVESAAGYEGLVLVPPADPSAIGAALRQLPARRGVRYRHPGTWGATASAYGHLIDAVHGTGVLGDADPDAVGVPAADRAA